MDAMIRITLNGTDREVPAGTSVAALLALVGAQGPVAIECNREVVVRARRDEHLLAAGDAIEIVRFVGGG